MKSRLLRKLGTGKILRNQAGMTLVEIMIVLIIIGGLATILATQLIPQLGKAKVKQAKIQMGEISKSLDMFYTDCGYYPDNLEGLVEAPESCSTWGPQAYQKNLPMDPWNSEYLYEPSGGSYSLLSLGQDRMEGGEALDKDIVYEN